MGKDTLTNREQEVVLAVLDGHTKLNDIAEHLGISYGTAHTYMNRIYEHYGVHSRAELVATIKKSDSDKLLALMERAVVALERIAGIVGG